MTKLKAIAAARRRGGRFVLTRDDRCLSLAELLKLPARQLPRGVVSWEYRAPDAADRVFETHGALQLYNRRGNLVASIAVVKACRRLR